jgi:hypothetical protein
MVDAARNHDIAYPDTAREKAMADKPTVTVTERGEIIPGTARTSYRRGFADLLDFTTPPARVTILPPGAPTTIGVARTGQAMREAMAAFEKARP